jgi:hypothetical protein
VPSNLRCATGDDSGVASWGYEYVSDYPVDEQAVRTVAVLHADLKGHIE